MVHIDDGNFASLYAALDPFDRSPELSEDIQQALVRLLGWDTLNQFWRKVLVNSNGALLTAQDSGYGRFQTISQVTVTTTSAICLAENTDRLSFALRNIGTNTIYLGLDSTVSSSNGWPLFMGEFYSNDLVTQDIWAIAAGGTQPLARIEIESTQT